jgi:hypothetical protein
LRGSFQFFMMIVGFWFFGQLWNIQFLEYWEILSTYENIYICSPIILMLGHDDRHAWPVYIAYSVLYT